MDSDTIPDVPVPVPAPDTVMVVLAESGPLNPGAVAVMAAVPALTPVTTPAGLTVATPGMVEVQVTRLVIFCVVGWDALPNVPVAVNCKVAPPTTKDAVAGVT